MAKAAMVSGGVLVSCSVSVSGRAFDGRASCSIVTFVAERVELFRQVDVEFGAGKLCVPAGTALLGSSLWTMTTLRWYCDIHFSSFTSLLHICWKMEERAVLRFCE